MNMNLPATLLALLATTATLAAPPTPRADWPEPRHDGTLTAIQPTPGRMTSAPTPLAEYDLGRTPPSPFPVNSGVLAIVAGGLRLYDPHGKQLWSSHPAGLTLTRIVACQDLDADGASEIVLEAGRPAQPFGAVVALSLATGKELWREDVEPMSYSWTAYVASYLPNTKGRQVLVVMQGYPPEKDNGYAALYEFPSIDKPGRRWRYPFSAYTCFPTVLTTDVDADGVKEICVISHSRMWVLDAPTGSVKQFIGWDVSPANVRSYGLNSFVDLDHDGREDFLCLANFSKHYEVLLNKNGQFQQAWHRGFADSVTTSRTALCWPTAAHADLDGDGKRELVVSVYEAGKWTLRIHDAVTGAIKFERQGLVAAGVGSYHGAPAILADRTDRPSRSQPDGGYDVEKTDGASLLQLRSGRLEEVWQDEDARALRSPDLRVTKAGQQITLGIPTPPAPAPTPIPAPPVVGTIPDELLIADVAGDSRNELIAYTKPTALVLAMHAGTLKKLDEIGSDCVPIVSDLVGDGKNRVVSVLHGRVRATDPRTKKVLWDVPIPTSPSATPWPNLLYLRPGRFLDHQGTDIFLVWGEPRVGSAVLDGRDGHVAWVKGECDGLERYCAPTHNLAAAHDTDNDGKDEVIFTNPDYYCVVDGATGAMKVGPVSPQTIFNQPSQGLYTLPAVVGDRICLTAGHYFQGSMTHKAEGKWWRTPVIGRARSAKEGFVQTPAGRWQMGVGRQDGVFECVNVADGKTLWTLDLHAAATDVIGCDVDGDGTTEFVFATTDGHVYAVRDGRVLWKLQSAPGMGAPIAGDLDGDGVSEIVAAGGDGKLRVYAASADTPRGSKASRPGDN